MQTYFTYTTSQKKERKKYKEKYFQKSQQYNDIKTSKEIHGRQQVTNTMFVKGNVKKEMSQNTFSQSCNLSVL